MDITLIAFSCLVNSEGQDLCVNSPDNTPFFVAFDCLVICEDKIYFFLFPKRLNTTQTLLLIIVKNGH